MKREIRFGLRALHRRPLLALLAWSVPEALPTTISGLAIAKAMDDGFLAGRPVTGLAWLGAFLLAACVGAWGSRQVFRRLGDLVEPFRDDLLRRVVGGALTHAVAGHRDDGALARVTRQVEIVRDSFAGLIVVTRGFAVTVAGVVLGLLSIDPVIVLLVLPPFALGFGAFVATLGLAAARERATVLAEERVGDTANAVLSATRDVVATGAEGHAAALAAEPIEHQAAAERALAWVAVLRTSCFAVGVWLPLIVLLLAAPWLVGRGLTAGAIMGGLTYILMGLNPALQTLVTGVGSSGLQFVVTLGRILDATAPPEERGPLVTGTPSGHDITLDGVTFAYGPHAEPVLDDLDLVVPEGDHLAIVGPSGIGKSTLAGLVCGLLRPGSGSIRLGGAPVTGLTPAQLARLRVLIPQEAYVFSGTVWDNLVYLRPSAEVSQVDRAVAEVGAENLLARLGGYPARLAPAELSAGERQLIALVRAYLSDAPVVILDEATCHLDPIAERRAEEAFAARGGTVVVIAHRISSALRAKRVLVLDGTDAVDGDPVALRSVSPLYRELLGYWHAEPPVPVN
ncbi:ABC transporter ATP-binding protein [Amycolatopsis sp. NPDC006131]|uniref:ABC transporter ATP-binding protein n=1 Tax=Amycolatopsis sp. NPDC006131 TaxID=3156731 RepID=UPI0033B0D878